MSITRIEGTLIPAASARFAIVASRFNEFIVERLVEGALDTFRRHGVAEANVTLVHVPGAFEIPVACRRIAEARNVDAIVALGCIIRGATAHFDHVANAATSGCSQVAQATGVPVVFGILTTDSIEQAIERAGTKAGNKGSESALAALEMSGLFRALSDSGFATPTR
jgi:6,7-dimethyl-8-ribityllumazine synthase